RDPPTRFTAGRPPARPARPDPHRRTKYALEPDTGRATTLDHPRADLLASPQGILLAFARRKLDDPTAPVSFAVEDREIAVHQRQAEDRQSRLSGSDCRGRRADLPRIDLPVVACRHPQSDVTGVPLQNEGDGGPRTKVELTGRHVALAEDRGIEKCLLPGREFRDDGL